MSLLLMAGRLIIKLANLNLYRIKMYWLNNPRLPVKIMFIQRFLKDICFVYASMNFYFRKFKITLWGIRKPYFG